MRTRRMNHEGCIVKKVSKDCAVRYEWRQMIDGVTRTLTAATMPELSHRIESVRDMPVSNNKVRVSEWNNKWLETYVKPLKKSATYEQYRIMIEHHIDPIIGKRYMRGILPSDIQHVIAVANKEGLSSRTMGHIRKVASCSFRQAVKDRLVGKSPVEGIEIPVKQTKAQKVLSATEFKAIMDALKKSRWVHSVRFALETALRRGELLALKWGDIDVSERRATIDESLDRDAVPGDTKSSKIHYVPLSTNSLIALVNQKEMLKKEGNPAIFRASTSKEAWVFPNKKGDALHPGSYLTLIARAGAKSGIKASPHMLRHTFVHIMRGGIGLKDLQNILGHEEQTTTLDIYGDIINDKTTEMAQSVDNAFAKFDEAMTKVVEKDGRVIKFKAN